MTTSEYAIGTLGAVCVGAVLLQIAPWLHELFRIVLGLVVDTIPRYGVM